MKKLYYVVEYQFETIGDTLECNGFKIVTLYSMENNEPQKLTILDLSVDSDSEEEIKNYLDDNGYGDEDFKFIQL